MERAEKNLRQVVHWDANGVTLGSYRKFNALSAMSRLTRTRGKKNQSIQWVIVSWQLSFPWKIPPSIGKFLEMFTAGEETNRHQFLLLNSLTVLIILLPEREIVVHVWRIGIVEQVGGQLPLQTDRFMRQFSNLNEQFLIIWYRKRHCCTLCPSLRPRAQILKEQPSDSNSANKNWTLFVSRKCGH